ncbi:hypothetical protein [Amycolatopsis sp. FDAARGOS 1241]|uniref:hypothetical protein n=1 Tax=Amycolatopsis sp. FDAARGOS 1241 TaxID=2778070 RepID=UPI001951D0BC|nr:hypothetical protein [Amycolatopsis sp. FDAARGOS 1241]QRP43587.1 hypothetical protein I6J71_29910 [Amycolatopsis sp. FDAARGOS 1241]
MAAKISEPGASADVGEAQQYAVHFWAKDTRNHRYLRAQLQDPDRDVLVPECAASGPVIPTRWAFRSELSQELGENRDRGRDCRPCFRGSRSSQAAR